MAQDELCRRPFIPVDDISEIESPSLILSLLPEWGLKIGSPTSFSDILCLLNEYMNVYEIWQICFMAGERPADSVKFNTRNPGGCALP